MRAAAASLRRFAGRLAPGGLAAVVLTALACAVSCSNVDFEPANHLASVRILAVRADNPYAAPGETVELEVLAVDARKAKPSPMKISWIPFVCANPINDLYYACFAQLAGGGAGAGAGAGTGADGGAGGGSGAGAGIGGLLRPGVDLTPLLPSGPKYSVKLPSDIVMSHPKVEGTDVPYGLAVVFDIACAGHVELVERDPGNPQSPPLACFDAAHNRLGPDDYEIGFSRIYAYDTRRNQNPVIDGVIKDGAPVDLAAGIQIPPCTLKRRGDCPKIKIDVAVPASSHELHDGDVDKNGVTQREQIWASYFNTSGSFNSEARLLYDTRQGKIDDSGNDFQAPPEPGDLTAWIVVHDNRDGVDWVTFPIHVR